MGGGGGGNGGGGGRVAMMNSKGCSRLFNNISSSFPSFRRLQSPVPMSPASSSSIIPFRSVDPPSAPFSGLVICVTGLSKEARTQVRDATERLGGRYSSDLHPQCTHLVVQSFYGRKFEHALKHGSRNSLFVVTLGWFVDSVRKNVRLSESLYSVKSVRESGVHRDDLNQLVNDVANENSCLPVSLPEHAKHTDQPIERHLQFSERSKRSVGLTFSGQSLYVDPDVSTELQSKVVEAAAEDGAVFVDQWFVGCNASHVVCEGPSIRKYLGHSNNLVTPLWVLKTAKEKHLQRLVHVSADLARQLGSMLDGIQSGLSWEEINGDGDLQDASCFKSKSNHGERQNIVDLAKIDVRKRRCRHMQTCQTVIRPITPSVLLDSICWSISEPTSTATIYTDSLSADNARKKHTSVPFDPQEDGKEMESSFVNLTRPPRESEKTELIFKNHFITILFPVDRFSEMGPSSQTFFSDTGFTCLQVLDHIYAFYQENMSSNEIEMAIHTDSRHADRLRSLYASKETAERGYVSFKRIDFLGSRRSFEMLKRITGDNSSNVYELVIRA